MPEATPVALTIAGSDSSGGAGLQADLKAFAAAGVHGACAVTAVTVQSTVAVTGVHPVPPEVVVDQVAAVLADLDVAAVKVGMLGDRATIAAVARALAPLPAGVPVVLDPVMVAESGARLLDAEATDALVGELLPRATVVTPNVPEGRALAGLPDEEDAEALAGAVLALGPGAVVLTGGHRAEATDVLVRADVPPVRLPGPRAPDGAAHGSGCTHAATLAALLARGAALEAAARGARAAAGAAVARGPRDVGRGVGPVDVVDLAARRAAVPVGPAAVAR